MHPRPKGCAAEVYNELVKCWSVHPDRRPDFGRLKAFFLATRANMTAAAAGSRRTGGSGGAPPATDPAGLAHTARGHAYDLGHADLGANVHYNLGHQDVADAGQPYNLAWGEGRAEPAAPPRGAKQPAVAGMGAKGAPRSQFGADGVLLASSAM